MQQIQTKLLMATEKNDKAKQAENSGFFLSWAHLVLFGPENLLQHHYYTMTLQCKKSHPMAEIQYHFDNYVFISMLPCQSGNIFVFVILRNVHL